MKRGERGYVLIEILTVTVLVALIGGAAMTSMVQMVRGSERSNDHITAVQEVQKAGYWICRDVHRSQQIISANITPPNTITVTWTDWSIGDKHQVVYSLENMPGSTLKKLQRSDSINGGAPNTTFVAQYIDPNPANTTCEFADGQLILQVTARVSLGSIEKSETRVFQIRPRTG
jgi:type II secretory pathway pseudopilin PulG